MKLTQDWVGYLDRSFARIKQSLLNRLVVNNPEISDHTEGNVLIIIISMFSGIAEMLNLYIDRMAQESFLGTARRYSSGLKIIRLIDYRAKARRAAQATLTFTITDSSTGLPANLPTTLLIPAGFEVDTPSGLGFLTMTDLYIQGGTSRGEVTAIQNLQHSGITIGPILGIPNEAIQVSTDYEQGSMVFTQGGLTWNLVDTLARALPQDRVFIIETDEEQMAYIRFGDGVKGKIPSANVDLIASYRSTEGELGNVPPNQLTDIIAPPTLSAGLSLSVTNQEYAVGGRYFETLDEIRSSAPRSLRTLERAVTAQDYIDIALLHPYVGKATIRYCCGEPIKVYIAPTTRGFATASILADVQSYIRSKGMFHRPVEVLNAGLSRIYLKMTVQGQYLYSISQVNQAIAEALNKAYGFEASDINRDVRRSDIIALIDNLPEVKYLTIDEIWVEPYATPLNNSHQLQWTRQVLPEAKTRSDWRLVWRNYLNAFQLYKDNVYLGPLALYTTYTDLTAGFTFQLMAGSYADGDTYTFVVYPYNQDVILDNNTIPIIDIDLTTNPASGFYTTNITPTVNPVEFKKLC